MQFSAPVVSGSGRGKDLGSPTLNVDIAHVPDDLDEGVYACTADVGSGQANAVLHYGPRDTFQDSRSCEIHLLDEHPEATSSVEVQVIQRLRDVQKFPSAVKLQKQIATDIAQARVILASHATSD